MPLLNTLGKPLTGQDILALKVMLKGSLDNHIRRIEYGKKYSMENGYEGAGIYDEIASIYREGMEQVETKIDLALASSDTISVDGFISGLFSDLENKAYDHLKTLEEDDPIRDDFVNEVARHFGSRGILKYYGKEGEDWELDIPDRPDALSETAASFTLATEPMEGVEDIGGYNPNNISVKLLYSGRAGNSATLGRNINELEQRKQQIQSNDSLNTEEKNEELKKIDQQIIETRNGVFGLNTGAEVSRIHSSQMMAKKDPITFSDLYNAFSELNQVLRPADPKGGSLRVEVVNAGRIRGVNGTQIPGTLIKTMDMIADGMNKVKATEDENLRKTRAIQLASFAYSMLVSVHPFADGNGRTCRLFADTILQTFGLPPHIPVKEGGDLAVTIGGKIDFNKAADVFLQGVKASDNIIKPQIKAINDEKEAEMRRGREGMESLVRNINENVRYYNEAVETGSKEDADTYSANIINRNLAIRKHRYLLDAIFDPKAGLTNEDLMAAMNDEEKNSIQKKIVFASIRRIHERALQPDGTQYPTVGDGSIQYLPYEEQLRLYEQYITKDERGTIFREAVKLMLNDDPGRLETFMGDLSAHIGPKMGSFYDYVRNAPGVERELTEKEKRDYPYNDRIAELRNRIQSNTAYTDEQKEQYLSALDNAEELTSNGKEKLCDEGSIAEKAFDNINTIPKDKSIAAVNERFKDSDHISHRPMFKGEGGANGLLPEREDRFRGVYDTEAPLTEKYKQTIVRMLQKMRDMEVLPKNNIYAGRAENGTKDYAFAPLLKARTDYIDAIQDGNIDRLPELKEKYDREYRNAKELMDMAHEGFGDKPYNMPGNLNGHRHTTMFPYEFLEDMTAQSQVNGVYQIYLAMHRLNMDDAQEFMDHFGENMVKAEAVRGEKFTLKKCLKGKNDMDSLLDLIAGDEGDSVYGNYELMMGVNRWDDALMNMAPEGNDYDEIVEYSQNVMAAMDDVKARYISKYQILIANYDENKNDPGYDVIMQARKNTLENLITVEDRDRDPDAIVGVQSANPDGTLKEVFDINAYAASHQPDVNEMKQRVDKMLQRFESIDSPGAVKRKDVLQAAARSYARLLKSHEWESGSEWYQDLKRSSLDLLDTMEKESSVANEDKALLRSALQKNYMSPKESQFLLNEMTHMLTVDEEIRNEWKTLYDEKPEKADLTLNNNKIDQNGKENFLDYANLFEQRNKKSSEEAYREHSTDRSGYSYAGHKANNIKDPLTLMTTFFELPEETRDRMPRLKEYMKKRAPLMEFLVNAKTDTDFEAHTSLTTKMAENYNPTKNGEFTTGVLYNSNDGIKNKAGGLKRCDMHKKPTEQGKNLYNGNDYLKQIEKAAGITGDAAKEELLSQFEKEAGKNSFRSEKVRGKLEAAAHEIRGISGERTYSRLWDAMPKTKWWHKAPDANSAITKVQEALSDLNTSMDSLGNDFSAGNRTAVEDKLRAVIAASDRYLNEKDEQKNISTELSAEERLSHNNVRTGFGQQRYQAVYDIRRECMAKLESLQRANRNYNALTTELEETISLENKENEYFADLEKHNAEINREIDSLKEQRDRLQVKYDGLDKVKDELRKDIEDYDKIKKDIKDRIDTARKSYVYNECEKNPEYAKLLVDLKRIESNEESFRQDAPSNRTMTRQQYNKQMQDYDEQRTIIKDEIKRIVDGAMKQYKDSGQREKDERNAEEQAKEKYLSGFNDRDKALTKYNEIMDGKSQQRYQQFESKERYPVQKELGDLNSRINGLSDKIKEPKDTAPMWKEHDAKYMKQVKVNKVEAAHDVINEINNRPAANNNGHVHHSQHVAQNELNNAPKLDRRP